MNNKLIRTDMIVGILFFYVLLFICLFIFDTGDFKKLESEPSSSTEWTPEEAETPGGRCLMRERMGDVWGSAGDAEDEEDKGPYDLGG